MVMRKTKKPKQSTNLFSTLKSNKLLSKEDSEALEVACSNHKYKRSNAQIVELLVKLGKHIKLGKTVESFAHENGLSARTLRDYRNQFKANPNKFLRS